MFALLAKNPVMRISDTEATQLAKALKEVMKHHKINVAPQTMAYMNLVGCMGVIYGPKIALLVAMKKPQPTRQAQTAPAPVMPNATGPQGPIVFN